MKLTMLEVINSHRGLPFLVERLLVLGEVERALEVAGVVGQLQPKVEMFQLAQSSLLNAHGTTDRATQQKVITAGSSVEKYSSAMGKLLEEEIEVDFDPILVYPKEVKGIDKDAFVSMAPVIQF